MNTLPAYGNFIAVRNCEIENNDMCTFLIAQGCFITCLSSFPSSPIVFHHHLVKFSDLIEWN